MNQPRLTIVVPCYNEEEVLHITYNELRKKLTMLMDSGLIHSESKILFVDDGSKDSTWFKIEDLVRKDSAVTGLKLARNFGHQKALLAGMEEACKFSDCIISIDADLQDDIDILPDFIEKYLEGYDVVYGVRKKRDTDTVFKRTTANFFYSLMEKMGLSIVKNHADYRLLSKRALEALFQFKEVHLFLRGMIPLIGFKSTNVYYDRKERQAGESKYPLKKMLSFAFDGITSFTIKPIRFITVIGFLSSTISIFAAIYVLFQRFLAHPISGWASIMISLWFIGGLMLLSLGLIGEYIGKIYEEVKHRPRYIVETFLSHQPSNNESEKRMIETR